MTTFQDSFDLMYATLTEARAKIRINGEVIEKALSSGLGQNQTEDEYGRYQETNCTVRIKTTDESKRNAANQGEVVDVLFSGASEWESLRIAGRRSNGGIITLTMETAEE